MTEPTAIADYRILPVEPEAISANRRLGQRIWANKGFVLGAVVLTLIVLIALFAPLLVLHDPNATNLLARRVPPVWHLWFDGDMKASWAHPLGTDQIGRDYYSRLLLGARVSLTVAFVAVVVSGIIGTTLGIVAGYFGGWIDAVISFFITTRLSMPVMLVALAVVSIYGGSLTIIAVVLGLLLWDRFAVVMRAATQQVRSLDYVIAAEATGASTPRIIIGEVLPNVLPHLVVVASVEAASAILLEAALSFLGLGVQPPLPSWGLMIAEAKTYMFFSFWLIAIPGTALALLVLAINMVGDGIRDVTAPGGRN